MSAPRYVALIPTFDNPDTVGDVVDAVRRHVPDVLVIDDGSGAAGRAAVAALADRAGVQVHHRPRNGGKGQACLEGFEIASARGFSHALQVDADGQHALEDVPRFIAASQRWPAALVAGVPRFGPEAPPSRVHGRKITRWWARIETLGPVVDDPLCGFRIYPLEAVAGLRTGPRMEFDLEIAVRMVWQGTPVVNLETRVRYPEGGVSHFRMVADNARISMAHARLCCGAVARLPWLLRGRGARLEARHGQAA